MVPDIGLQPFSHTCYSVLSSILGYNSEWVLLFGFFSQSAANASASNSYTKTTATRVIFSVHFVIEQFHSQLDRLGSCTEL